MNATSSPDKAAWLKHPALLSELRSSLKFRLTKVKPEGPRFFASSPQVLRGICPHGYDWSCHVSVGVLIPPTGEYFDLIQFNRTVSVFCDYRMTISDYAQALADFFCRHTQKGADPIRLSAGYRGPEQRREQDTIPGLASEACIVKVSGHIMGCETCEDTRIVEHIRGEFSVRRKMQQALQLHNDPRMNECLAESLFQ